MHKIKLYFTILFTAVAPLLILAQNNTNSPYTRYGFGELSDQTFTSQRAMGGIGYGLRESKMINPLNPAAFSSVDSMTFMVDMGVAFQSVWLNDGGKKVHDYNGNIEYIAMQFPLYKSLGMGLGFKPISYVGYHYGHVSSIGGSTVESSTFTGTGGLNQVYSSLSYNILNRLSLGLNVAYLFGDVKHRKEISYNDNSFFFTNISDTLRTSGLNVDFGFQYTHVIDKNKRLVVGGVYTPKLNVNGNVMHARTEYNVVTGMIENLDYTVSRDYKFETPESYGLGVSYSQVNKLTVGVDFLHQKWADAMYFSKTDTLNNSSKLSFGGEFIPDSRSRNFFKKMRYRVGGNLSSSYIKVKGSGYNAYGGSLGIGIPMNDNRSFLNLTVECKSIRPEIETLIDEQYIKFTFSYTFNELWFLKRKIQ